MRVNRIHHSKQIPVLGVTVGDFWSWAYSDVLSNTNRSALAEFLVGTALGVTETPRIGWDVVDLRYRGHNVEVKASAFIQSWNHKKPSKIQFDIAPKRPWNPDTNEMGKTPIRSADCYVFCLLTPLDKQSIDPFDVNQWNFYVVSRSVIDHHCPKQKSIGLKRLTTLTTPVVYSKLREQIDKAIGDS